MKRIGLADLAAEYQARGSSLVAQIARVAESGQFILGSAVASFESALAAACGVRHAVGVASGSDALTLALRAVGVGAGDVVVTTPLSFIATAEAVARIGASPCFVDVDPDTLCLSADRVGAYLEGCARDGAVLRDPRSGGRIGALLPVHLYGRVADLGRLSAMAAEAEVPIVQDAAQAVGARAGGTPLGHHGTVCVSFFPTKNLGGWGDGGAVLSDDDEVARQVRSWRVHGATGPDAFASLGLNSRLDALQAAVLEVKLGWLAEYDERRRDHARFYRRRLAPLQRPEGLRLPAPLAPGDVVHQFTVRVPASWRAELRAHLDRQGVATAVYYSRLLCDQPALAAAGIVVEGLAAARSACAEVLSLPVHPQLTAADLDRVATAVAEFVRRRDRR